MMDTYTISYGSGALLGIPLFIYTLYRAGGPRRYAARMDNAGDPSEPSFVLTSRMQYEPETNSVKVAFHCLMGLFVSVFAGWLFFGFLIMGACLALGMKG